jgi:hypothetical protein
MKPSKIQALGITQEGAPTHWQTDIMEVLQDYKPPQGWIMPRKVLRR